MQLLHIELFVTKVFFRSEFLFWKDNLYVPCLEKMYVIYCTGFSNDCDCSAKRLHIVMIRREQRRSSEFLSDCVSSSFSFCVVSEKELRCSSKGVKLWRSEAEVFLSSTEFKNKGLIPPNPTRLHCLHRDNYTCTL